METKEFAYNPIEFRDENYDRDYFREQIMIEKNMMRQYSKVDDLRSHKFENNILKLKLIDI